MGCSAKQKSWCSCTTRTTVAHDHGIVLAASAPCGIVVAYVPVAVYSQAMGVAVLLLCTMVKNESNYIVEWIEFHKIQARLRSLA